MSVGDDMHGEKDLKIVQFEPRQGDNKNVTEMMEEIGVIADRQEVVAGGYVLLTADGTCHVFEFANRDKALAFLGGLDVLKASSLKRIVEFESEESK